MNNKNVKCERIPMKFRKIYRHWICEERTKFRWKILFHKGVIKFQISMTKYLSFQYGAIHCSCFTFQQDNALAHRIPRLHHSSSVASQQSWPQPGWLSDLAEAAGACVPQPDSWRRPAEVVPGEWQHFQQAFIDEAVRQWRSGLWACIRAHGGHFEHRL